MEAASGGRCQPVTGSTMSVVGSIQGSRDVNTKHTQGCQRRGDEMNSTGSVPASRWHTEFGAGTGFGGTGNAWSVWGTLGIVVWVSQVFQTSWGDLQPELRAEDPCKTSCQSAGSPLGSSWNVAAAPSRAAGAGPKFLRPNNSGARASPQPLGLSATPLSPDMPGTLRHQSKPGCFLPPPLLSPS